MMVEMDAITSIVSLEGSAPVMLEAMLLTSNGAKRLVVSRYTRSRARLSFQIRRVMRPAPAK